MTKGAQKNELARAMRKNGRSLTEISDELSVPKSTIAYWCKTISLTERQAKRLALKRKNAGSEGRLKGAQANKDKKLEKIHQAQEKGRARFSALTDEEFFILGAALYWGEGAKTDHLSFINSDPDMVLVMKLWLQTYFGVQEQDFVPRIYINETHRKRESCLLAHWSLLLQLPEEQFARTVFLKQASKKRYANHDSYFGLLSLRVRRSTDIKYRILGLIHGLKNSKLPLLPM